jgi:uncharacterized RmlC-like cupin family protein
MSQDSTYQVKAVTPQPEITTKQGVPYFLGISGDTAGSKGLSMHLITLPPGAVAAPHRHQGYETGIYVLEGEVETCYGEGLTQSVVSRAGEFLFIPPDVPHNARNLSDTQPARAIVARNDPNEQENTVHYDPAAHQTVSK